MILRMPSKLRERRGEAMLGKVDARGERESERESVGIEFVRVPRGREGESERLVFRYLAYIRDPSRRSTYLPTTYEWINKT